MGSEGYREHVLLLIHSPNGHNSQFWAKIKPGLKSPVGLPTWVLRTKFVGHISAAFPGGSAEIWIRSGIGICTMYMENVRAGVVVFNPVKLPPSMPASHMGVS